VTYPGYHVAIVCDPTEPARSPHAFQVWLCKFEDDSNEQEQALHPCDLMSFIAELQPSRVQAEIWARQHFPWAPLRYYPPELEHETLTYFAVGTRP